MQHKSLALLLLAACATTTALPEKPLPKTTTAYAVAERIALPATRPEEHTGLHNIYHLSERIVSGSEPEGPGALRKLKEMGIKTILSVDGKVPDHATAEQLGMRYVHVPIRYKGFTEDELLSIAKTFRELDGPFYVHCFHGKHRGPAAAAVGRVVLDGASRAQAVAEMRQWCGTSKAYEGLYAAIAFDELPDAAKTKAYGFDFPEAHRLSGFRSAMIALPRAWDPVAASCKRSWQVDPDHPDLNARNETEKVVEILTQCLDMEDVRARPADFRGHLESSKENATKLAALLRQLEGGNAAAAESAKGVVKQIEASCKACHLGYRDN